MSSRKTPKNTEASEIRKAVEAKVQKSVVVPELLTAKSKFRFKCYPGIACFTKCCSGIKIFLTPYDIFRLKTRLGLEYKDFLVQYTEPAAIEKSQLPVVSIRLNMDEARSCPFLTPEGCSVYSDRPLTCRYYPIGMGTMKKDDSKTGENFFIKIKEEHCLGHNEATEWTIDEWRADQESDLYDEMNSDWMAVVLKAKTLGPVEFSQKSLDLFFIVSTNLDLFKEFVLSSKFIEAYGLDREYIDQLMKDELEFLKFSLKWLRFVMFDEGDFKVDEEARKIAKEKLLAQREKQRKEAREKDEQAGKE
ncbi:MAG: YkgJ family cysteine cluster protein [Nitrospirae bacterium]|nr:YkgJ family cysteine cluster protein [Nitrospirota bacterium]